MKQNTSTHLPVKITGVTLANVSTIRFMFKQYRDIGSEKNKLSTYKSDGTGDCTLKTGTSDTILIPWTKEETYKFEPNKPFYMDTEITLTGTQDQPQTPIIELIMEQSLFAEDE